MAKTRNDVTRKARAATPRRAARPMAAPAQDLATQLRALMDLHRDGVLTTAELASSRARLLWTPRVSARPKTAAAPARRAKPAQARPARAHRSR